MPIRNDFGAQAHLNDDTFAELWSARLDGTERRHPHLDDCARCQASYAAFTGWLADLRADAHAEADELFPAGRLAAQRVSILQRLEAQAPPGRVISFPGQTPARPVVQHRRARWMAVAAAAALFVGLAAGQLLDVARSDTRQLAGARPATPDAVQTAAAPSVREAAFTMDDSLFYSDAAVTSPRVEALQALDAITPRVRDVENPQ